MFNFVKVFLQAIFMPALFFLFCGLFLVPWVWLFLGVKDAVFAAIGVSLGLLILSSFAEVLLRKFHHTRCDPGIPNFLRETLTRDFPQAVLLSDPSVTVYLAKSLFSKNGSIFISQGVLNLLSNEELTELMTHCEFRSRDPMLKLQSLGAVLASAVIHSQLLPRQWVQTLFFENQQADQTSKSHPLSLVRFLIFYPLVKAIIVFSGSRTQKDSFRPKDSPSAVLDHAMQKIVLENRRCMAENNPGAVRLYLINSWPNSLVNLT